MEENSQVQKIEGGLVKIEDQPTQILILPDTSWLVAILDEKDSHHVAAISSLGAILPYKPAFSIPVLVGIETISRLIRVNKLPVKKCKEKVLDLFADKLNAGSSRTYEVTEVFKQYNLWSRKEVRKLTAIDFCVATEGISLGAKILTCDLKMYRIVNKYYKNIYFMTDNVRGQRSDLARLIRDMQKNLI